MVRPTYEDLIAPEMWIAITEKGRAFLAGGAHEPPSASTSPEPSPISRPTLGASIKKPKDLLRTAFGLYELHEQIGCGGVGVVYRATDENGEVRAIKILDAAKATSRKLLRFQNEILFGMRHDYRNVIRVLDHGLVDGAPFFVMPRLPQTLRTAMRRGLRPVEALRY